MLFSTLILANVSGSICKADANSIPHCGHVNDSVLSTQAPSACPDPRPDRAHDGNTHSLHKADGARRGSSTAACFG